VKVDFMRSMLLLQPREDTDVNSEQYKASVRISTPLNGERIQSTEGKASAPSRE